MSGELRLMPMPAWERGGRRTSTWGATMLAVTTAGDNQDMAWELAKYLYISGDIARKTFSETNIISPFRSTWSVNASGNVRQRMEQFDLVAQTWEVWFDGFYRRVD